MCAVFNPPAAARALKCVNCLNWISCEGCRSIKGGVLARQHCQAPFAFDRSHVGDVAIPRAPNVGQVVDVLLVAELISGSNRNILGHGRKSSLRCWFIGASF